jgi:hypothetical protein
MRRTLGVAVFSGMLGVTLFGIFLTPVFFNVVEWFIDHRLLGAKGTAAAEGLLVPLRALKRAMAWRVTRNGHGARVVTGGLSERKQESRR